MNEASSEVLIRSSNNFHNAKMRFISFPMVKYMTHNSKSLGEKNTSSIRNHFPFCVEQKSQKLRLQERERERVPYLVGFILLINFAYTSSIDEILKTSTKPRLKN
jgi:hypothetical protein